MEVVMIKNNYVTQVMKEEEEHANTIRMEKKYKYKSLNQEKVKNCSHFQ
jgi:hypothetical protein